MTDYRTPAENAEAARRRMLLFLEKLEDAENEVIQDFAYQGMMKERAAMWAAIYTACVHIAGD